MLQGSFALNVEAASFDDQSLRRRRLGTITFDRGKAETAKSGNSETRHNEAASIEINSHG
jgi:hypothetical protein